MAENGKWQIGFWVITVLVIGSFTWTTICYLQNQGRIERTMEKVIVLKDIANECLHKIDRRLDRIEAKLGVETKEFK